MFCIFTDQLVWIKKNLHSRLEFNTVLAKVCLFFLGIPFKRCIFEVKIKILVYYWLLMFMY